MHTVDDLQDLNTRIMYNIIESSNQIRPRPSIKAAIVNAAVECVLEAQYDVEL